MPVMPGGAAPVMSGIAAPAMLDAVPMAPVAPALNVTEDMLVLGGVLRGLPFRERSKGRPLFTKKSVTAHIKGEGTGWGTPCIGTGSTKTKKDRPFIFATNREFAVLRFKPPGTSPPGTIENIKSGVEWAGDAGWAHMLYVGNSKETGGIRSKGPASTSKRNMGAVDWIWDPAITSSNNTRNPDASAIVATPGLPSLSTQTFLSKFVTNFKHASNTSYELCVDTTESAVLYANGKLLMVNTGKKNSTNSTMARACKHGYWKPQRDWMKKKSFENKYCAKEPYHGRYPSIVGYNPGKSPPSPDYVRAELNIRNHWVIDWHKVTNVTKKVCNKPIFPPSPTPPPPPTVAPTQLPTVAPTPFDPAGMISAHKPGRKLLKADAHASKQQEGSDSWWNFLPSWRNRDVGESAGGKCSFLSTCVVDCKDKEGMGGKGGKKISTIFGESVGKGKGEGEAGPKQGAAAFLAKMARSAIDPGSVKCWIPGPILGIGGCDRPPPCAPCAAGKFANTTMQSCVDCDVGAYNDKKGKGMCEKCKGGEYTGKYGSTSCKKCTPGKHTLGKPGATFCPTCPDGALAPVDGTSKCGVCPPGKFSEDPKAKKCLDCPTNFRSSVFGAKVCTKCPLGRHCESGWKGCNGAISTRLQPAKGGCTPNVCCCHKFGVGAILGECPKHGAQHCKACTQGYHLENRRALKPENSHSVCTQNNCTCPNGIARDVSDAANPDKRCAFNNEWLCKSCNRGYDFDSARQRRCVHPPDLVPDLPPPKRTSVKTCIKLPLNKGKDTVLELMLFVQNNGGKQEVLVNGKRSRTNVDGGATWLNGAKLAFTATPLEGAPAGNFTAPAKPMAKPKFVGCRKDCLTGRDLPISKGKAISEAVCAMRCFGYSNYGLSAGNRCWCGMAPGRQGPATKCTEAQCRAGRVGPGTSLQKCKNCVYELPKPFGGYLYKHNGPKGQNGLASHPLSEPCVTDKKLNVIHAMAKGLSNHLRRAPMNLDGSSWGDGNVTAIRLGDSNAMNCGSCITCVKLSNHHYECDINNAKLRDQMNTRGVWPVTVLYKGGSNIYAYLADEMQAPFYERVHVQKKNQVCKVDRRVLIGSVSHDGAHITWRPSKDVIPGLKNSKFAKLDVFKPFEVTGAEGGRFNDGGGLKCNGKFTYAGDHNGKIGFINHHKCYLGWREIRLGSKKVSTWTLTQGRDLSTNEPVVRYFSLAKGARGNAVPPHYEWKVFLTNANGGPYIKGGSGKGAWKKFSNELCYSDKPDLLRHYYAMGMTDTHAARCKAKCIQMGDLCSGFLHVTNYLAPGKAENPDKGQCFFKSGWVQAQTSKKFKRLGRNGEGEVFNSNNANEVGDCYVKDPLPKLAGARGRGYRTHYEEDCKLQGDGAFLDGKDMNGESKACQARCDQLAGYGCIGFVHIMSNDNQCKFIKTNVTHVPNNKTDVRDCHLVDETLITKPFHNPYTEATLQKAGKKTRFSPKEEHETEEMAELGASMGLRSGVMINKDELHVLYPLGSWSRMCSVSKELQAWNAWMSMAKTALRDLKATEEDRIANAHTRMMKVVWKFENSIKGENITATRIRAPLLKEASEKVHVEGPQKLKLHKEIYRKEKAVADEKQLMERTSYSERMGKEISESSAKSKMRDAPLAGKAESEAAQKKMAAVVRSVQTQMEHAKALALKRLNYEYSQVAREAADRRLFNAANSKTFAHIAKDTGLLPARYGMFFSPFQAMTYGKPGCQLRAVQTTAQCNAGKDMIGCLRGELVSYNCQCSGPFVYEASITQETSPQFRNGFCSPHFFPLHSKAELNLKQLTDWLDICVHKKVKLERPGRGKRCTKLMEGTAKQAELEEEIVAAQDKLKQDLTALHEANAKLASVRSANSVNGMLRSKAVLAQQMAANLYKGQQAHIESMHLRLLVLRLGSGSLTLAHGKAAKKRLAAAELDTKMKRAELAAAESSLAAHPNDLLVHEVSKLEGLYVRARSEELAAEKHAEWIRSHLGNKLRPLPPSRPVTVKVGRPFVAEDPLEALKGNGENSFVKEKVQKQLEQAKIDEKDAIRKQSAAKGKVGELVAKQNKADLHVKHKVGTTHEITRAQLDLVDAAKQSFYWKTTIQEYQSRIDALKNQKAPVKLKMELFGTTPAGSPIEAAMRKAGEELSASNMIPIPFTDDYWLPTSARCHQAFAFVTGTCNKGPYVNVRCDIGANVKTNIPVQGGCGCNHQFMHRLMIGNLEKRKNINEVATPQCIAEFNQNAQTARDRFFDYKPFLECSMKIEDKCRELKAVAPAWKRPPTMKETVNAVEKSKFSLFDRSVNAYELSTAAAKRRVVKLRAQLDSPAHLAKLFKFVEIPGMALKANGEFIQAAASVCKQACLNKRKCLSYSVDDKLEKCWLSASKLTYDDNYICYLKNNNLDETHSFNTIPGMRLQTLDGPSMSVQKDSTLNECRHACLNSDKCKAINYSESTKTCIISRITIEYDQGSNYYEKVEPLPYDPAPFDKRVATERKVKMESHLDLLDNLIKERTQVEEINIKKLAYERNLPQHLAAKKNSEFKQMEQRPVELEVPLAPNR